MNADDVFRYGHGEVLAAADALPIAEWEAPGVCGVWSTKDVIAHLASYELATGDVFASLLDEGPTPYLDQFLNQGVEFNDTQVAQRREQTAEETLAEYMRANERAAALLARIPVERRRQAGLLPWYGAEYDLEDLIAYMAYGHKREHSAQIAVFCCQLSGVEAS
jgi:Mycothiol maleylpyruvate isomerase N-terminal domain